MKIRIVGPVFFLFLLSSLALIPIKNMSDPISTTVKTTEGMVRGIKGKTGIISFKGIPFAARILAVVLRAVCKHFICR